MKTTRVLLADDHALVRAGIRSLLEKVDSVHRGIPFVWCFSISSNAFRDGLSTKATG
jgi:DNA-binding NarL/FixJ family response regulator